MTSNYLKPDEITGTADLDESFITDEWLIDQFVGNRLWLWGTGTSGVIGNAGIASYSSPVVIGTFNSWKSIHIGGTHAHAIRTNGTLWSWGLNSSGQSGRGVAVGASYSSPVQVGALTNWKKVAPGLNFSVGITEGGALYSWGLNTLGYLGNGTVTTSSTATQVGTLTNWSDIAAGGETALTTDHVIATKFDGTLWSWGAGTLGALGRGNATVGAAAGGIHYSSPCQVGSLTDWKFVSAGSQVSGCIKTDGTLWTWGTNIYGQLGVGNVQYYSSPVQVGALTNWKYINYGTDHCLAILEDGTMWTWGRNDLGQLGNGNRINYSSPIQVGPLNLWKYVSAGDGVSAAIKTDGTLWMWGAGAGGAIAQGNIINYSSPVQVGTLTNWKMVNAGVISTCGAIPFSDI
jgi:alpha-tubulin suppressor-like RCC1 family protein